MTAQTAIFSNNIDNVFNQFVAVGLATRSMKSLDGETWTATTLTAFPFLTDMSFGKNILVALGQTVNTAGMVYTTASAEALGTWTNRPLAPATALANIGWQDIAFGGGTWVAVGGGIDTTVRATATCTMTSTNSANWTKYTGLTSADWRCIVYGNSVFVTLSYGSNLARYSSDLGQTWSNGNSLPIGNWNSIVYDSSNSKFVAVAFQGTKVIAGTATCTSLQFTTGTNTITRVTGSFATDGYLTGQKIVISNTTSNNGTYTITGTVNALTMTVTESLVNEGALSSLATVNSRDGDGTAYSSDGITWATGTPSSPLLAARWTAIATNGAGRCIAVAGDTAGQIIAYTNDAGTNWTTVTLPLIATWSSIAYGSSGSTFHRWVAVNSTVANCAYSDDDGVSWSLGPMTAGVTSVVKWAPFPIHTNDTLTIQRGAIITVNSDQHPALSGITLTNGKLLIKNTSTSTPIRFVTARTSGATAQAITPSDGLGTIDIQGNWIQIGTGDNTASQTMTTPYTDYISALWVETGVSTGVYEIWLNVSGAYGGTLKQYQDGLLDVSTGQRGKFFIQTPNSIQDKYITAIATITFGLFTVTLDSTIGIYQGASITGQGIPANTVVEQVIDVTTITINQLPVTLGVAYTATGYTNISVKIFNPYASQFTSSVVFGDDVNGNKLTSGVKVRIPNIMITSDTPANLHTASQILGCYFNLGSGGNMLMDICLFDESYHNWNQTQQLTITNVGLHTRPILTETYALQVNGFALAMPAVRRYNTGNIWLGRDLRDTLTNSLLMNYVTGATLNNVVMVVQSPHAITAATITAPTGMFNLSFSNLVTVTNMRMYSLNTTKAYQCGLALIAPVTSSTFTNIEFYGGPMLSSQLSSSNTFTNLSNSETMFSHSHNYTAGMRVAHDPTTATDLVSGTKYYFKSRTFFSRDRTEYSESRAYGATPFKGDTYYPDYVTTYLNAPQSVTFGWTHRTPMYTAETSPLANGDAKNFLEIFRGTAPGFTRNQAAKVAGFNNSPALSIPTIVVWATDTRTLTLDNTSSIYTITASTGSFITDGFVSGQKVTVRGATTHANNKTYTITIVTATVITVTEAIITETAYTQDLSIVAKYVPTPKLFLTAAGGRTLAFTKATVTASARNLTFGGTVALPSQAPTMTATGGRTISFVRSSSTITCSSGSFITDGFLVGDKIYITGTTSNNTMSGNFFTLSAVVAGTLTVTVASDFLADEGPLSAVSKILAVRTTITCSSGSFITDGFVIGDKIKVTDTTSNNTAGTNYLTLTAVVATMLTCGNDLVFPEGPLSATTTLTASHLICSTGNFVTDGYAIGDIIDVSGSAAPGNNKTFTVMGVLASGTMLNFIEAATTQAAESSGATLTTKIMPIPKIVFLNASPNREIAFQQSVATAAATTRIMTFDYINRTIRATGTVPGNFLTNGFIVGDKVKVTGTSLNNKVLFTITVLTATLMTLGATDKVYDETSTSAVLTVNRIKSSTGSFLTDIWAIGDTVVVTGTTSNNGSHVVSNVVALALNVTSTLVNETLSYRTGAVITATKLLSRQKIYGTATRTFTTTATAKTLVVSSGSYLQDGYIVGDKVLVNGMGTDGNQIYTISALVALTLTWLEAAAPTTSLVATNAITWIHGGNRPIILASVATQTWDAVNKYLTLGTGTWDTTYGFIVGDKILVTGQKYNNGLFSISAISTNRITVTEAVIHDPAVYSAATQIIYGYFNPQKRTITAAAGRTLAFDNISKKVTASTGDFRVSAGTGTGDGYAVGDCVRIQNTAGSLNNGYFTISALTATVMNFNELVYTQSAVSSSVTISAPDIADATDYYYVVRKYDDTLTYHDSEEIYVKSTAQEPATNLALQGTAFANNKIATLHATAARTLAFAATTNLITCSSGSFVTDTYAIGDKIIVTRSVSNNGYYTVIAVTASTITTLENLVTETASATTGAITNIYWDNLNVPLFTASAVRTIQFTTSSSQGAGGRTLSFATKTITASTGSFITDGLVTGDKILISGTSSNNGLYTVTGTVNALTITTTESLITEAGNTVGLIRCRKITLAGTTPGSFITDGYAVNDQITLAGTTSNNVIFTLSSVEATKMTVYEAIVAEGPLSATATISNTYMTIGAATRISPFISTIAAQTAESLLLTSIIDNATLTQPISTAITNAYTFTVWVSTQPTIAKGSTLTAAAVRTYKFDGLSLTATGGRTLQWFSGTKTITASTGSFITDGYAIGDKLIITGTTSNNGTFTITSVITATITVSETLVNEGPLSATATIQVNKITAYGTTPGSFIANGFQVGDRILVGGSGTPPAGSIYNIGWFTLSNVVEHVLNVTETVTTEATATSILTITNYFNDTYSIEGEIRFGTAIQAFTATSQWQKISVSFTATAKLHNAVIQIDTQKRGLCVFGAIVNTGSSAVPYLTTTTAPVTIANKVRDIALVRAWCRGYGEAASHSGVELQLAPAVTGELWSEVYCGTTAGFTPTFANKIFDTWAATGQTLIFNQKSSDNLVDGFTQVGIGAPTGYGLAYFAAGSSSNRIKDLTYCLSGATQLYLATFLTQSNDQSFYNWNIKQWRNYASTVGNAAIFAASNANSGLIAENLIFDNSDFPIMDNALNFVIKGMSGGNIKPLNSALLNTMPVTPIFTLANTPSAAVNFDSVTTAATTTNYTTVYDTIFKELYHTSTTGSLFIQFNASAKTAKPYALTGTASFTNNGRLYLIAASDAIEYTWPHKILGVTGFQNVAFLLNGIDLGNTPSILEGIKVEYKIDTGAGYGANFAEATPATLSALSVSATAGFYLKLKLTAMKGMKYSTLTKPFVVGETIRGLTSLATAVVDRDYYYAVQGTLWLSSVTGTFAIGETLVRDSDGEMRAINVATNTTFALFPSVTSYIDGLQIYSTVDQTAKYPANVATITLTNIVPDSRYYIYNTNTSALVATGTATGTPAPGETTIDYTISITFIANFDITVNVRKSSSPVKYLPYETGATVTATGANVFIAQVIDTVVLSSYGSISSDWTVNLINKTVKHTSGSTVYSVKNIYSWLGDYFDDLGVIDDQVPMSASTPTEYNLINGWFINDDSFQYLSGGAITSIAQTSIIYLLTFASGGYTSAVAGDIGKVVHDGGSTHTGTLLDYDNTNRKWWVRKTLGTFANSDVITITTGTGAGTILASAGVATGESIWSNLFTLGTIVAGTTLDVYQNDTQITPWWTSGHIDIIVKVTESGSEIDSGNLTILARIYGSLYDHYVIDSGSGRNPVPLAAFTDGNNQTASGTVGTYTGITFTFGASSHDMGAGLKPYDVEIDGGANTLQRIYEYLKYVTRTGSSTTLNALNGEFYTGVGDIRFAYDTEASGPFVQGERINGTGSNYGYLVSLIDSGTTGTLVLRNVHGTFIDNMTLTGVTSGATALVNGAVDTMVASKTAPFGTFAGGTFFGARGVWLYNVAPADANNYQLTDSTATLQTPPQTIAITVNGVVAGDRVAVFRASDASGTIDKTYLTSHNTNNVAGDTTIDVTTTIPSDTPSSGNLRLVNNPSPTEHRFRYTSWTGSTFTLMTIGIPSGTIDAIGDVTGRSFVATNANLANILPGDLVRNTSDGTPGSWALVTSVTLIAGSTYQVIHTPLEGGSENDWDIGDGYAFNNLPLDYSNTDTVYVPYLDQTATSTSVSVNVTYIADRDISTQVRKKGIIPFNTNAVALTSTGYTATAVRTTDNIVT